MFTTRLAKSHGEIVVEGMNVAGLMQQKGLPGVRKRRRDLADTAMGEARRQLRYKVPGMGDNWQRPTLSSPRRSFVRHEARWVDLVGLRCGGVLSAVRSIRGMTTRR